MYASDDLVAHFTRVLPVSEAISFFEGMTRDDAAIKTSVSKTEKLCFQNYSIFGLIGTLTTASLHLVMTDG